MTSAETWRERATFWAYRGLEQLAMTLPEEFGRRAFTAFGDVAYRRLSRVRAIVAANQARVLGLDPSDDRVQASTREAFELYARYWFDTFRIPAMTRAMVNARIELVGFDHVEAALAKGRGCVLALPHMGNWDLAGRFLAVNGHRIVSVAEELRPARLAALFHRHREALGMRIIPLTDDATVAPRLLQLLSDNWIVALVADRDFNGRGVEVEMFRGLRRVPAGPARLSLASEAPLLVCPVYTTTRGWWVRVSAPLEVERSGDMRADVTALTRLMAAEFERAIAVKPSDWHLFQPAWSDASARAMP